MLDVAACADVLVGPHLARMAAHLGVAEADADRLRRILVTLIALHDLGKFSNAFLALIGDPRPDGLAALPTQQGLPHWQATLALLHCHDKTLKPVICNSHHARTALYRTVAGHHGRPPHGLDQGKLRAVTEENGAKTAARFIEQAIELIDPQPIPGLSFPQAAALSWPLAGLTTLADWIGSNQSWFPYSANTVPLADYWKLARQRAANAVRQAGAVAAKSTPFSPALDWLDLPALRPMQAAARAAPLPDGPVLLLIEDATGAGKTEASLILAHRLIAAGRAGGLYTALPTMATANAMFDRFGKLARGLFQEPPSLALAHGRRALHKGFRAAVGANDASPSDPDAPTCAQWIADDRRRTFLAEVGVGTIDQALQAVLPVKFSALRLWGLSGRVLIVDEAHAYDAYMIEELKALLAFQARMGGSAIVMTATLPTATRAELARAFLDGLGADDRAVAPPRGYPSLTTVGRDGVAERVVAPAPHTVRRVPVVRIATEHEALDAVVAAANAGAAVAWVRNAVDDAIAAARRLEDMGAAVDLFHARFAMRHRLDIERAVARRFGPDGSVEDRRGRILVATQVIEQSLDLDFDVMVSDLAPVDLLIQRAGRLWRHMDRRPASGRPGGACRLLMLAPDPAQVTNSLWLHGVLGAGAHVYGQALLWRTADAIAAAGAFDAPHGLRALIDGVYDEQARKDAPEPLLKADLEDAGEARAGATLGQWNALKVETGYGASGKHCDDALYPTRLGRERQALALARRSDGGVVPLAAEAGGDADRNWALAEVSVGLKQFRGVEPGLPAADSAIAAAMAGWPAWRKNSIRIVVVEPDGAIAPGLRYDLKRGLVFA